MSNAIENMPADELKNLRKEFKRKVKAARRMANCVIGGVEAAGDVEGLQLIFSTLELIAKNRLAFLRRQRTGCEVVKELTQ